MERLSRAALDANLDLQNDALVFGTLALLHPACPCQKQPFTKTTARRDLKTRSGFPGRLASCSLNRKPLTWR